MSGTPIAPTPWKPSDLPTLRAAYSDRTAALMAYLAAFAYDTRIEAKGVLQVPPELAAFGFDKLTSFHNGMTDGWAYIAEGADLIALSFRGTSSTKNLDTDFRVTLIHPDNTDQQLRVHEGFYRAFVKLNEGKLGIEIKWAPSSRQRMAQSRFTSPGIHWAVRSLKLRRLCLAAIRLGLATLMVRRASAILISIYG